MTELAQTEAAAPAPWKRTLGRIARPVLGLLLPVALAAGWEMAVKFGWSNGRLVPPPSVIYAQFVELIQAGELQVHAAATLGRVAAGFFSGVAVGTVLGGAGGLFRAAASHRRSIAAGAARDPIHCLGAAVHPVVRNFRGLENHSDRGRRVFPVYLGVMGAVSSVDRKIVEVGRAFRLSGFAMIRRILLPAVLPAYVLSLRAGLGLGWMFVVAAEFLGASQGLGYLLIDGQQLGKPAQIVAAIVAFAILGKFSDWLIVLVSTPFLRWQDSFGTRREA